MPCLHLPASPFKALLACNFSVRIFRQNTCLLVTTLVFTFVRLSYDFYVVFFLELEISGRARLEQICIKTVRKSHSKHVIMATSLHDFYRNCAEPTQSLCWFDVVTIHRASVIIVQGSHEFS